MQFTTATGQVPLHGIKLSVPTTGKCFYSFSSGITTENGFYINGIAEIHPASFADFSTIYFISDTAAQSVSYEVVGQSITVS